MQLKQIILSNFIGLLFTDFMFANKTILLTGATDGIGLQTAGELAKLNIKLILHGKNPDKGNKIIEKLISETGNTNIHYYNVDLSSFKMIEGFTAKINADFNQLDILINNAGIYESNKVILQNGLEKSFMVNYLSSFVLTLQLLPSLKKGKESKIINLSSMVHASNIDFENLNAEKSYSGSDAYSLSKLCNILFTYKLAELLKNDKVSVNALHPGVINTKLLRAGWGPFGNATIEGAKRIMFLVKMSNFVTGKYFENDKQIKSAAISYDKNIQNQLWDYSIKTANKFLQKPIKL